MKAAARFEDESKLLVEDSADYSDCYNVEDHLSMLREEFSALGKGKKLRTVLTEVPKLAKDAEYA